MRWRRSRRKESDRHESVDSIASDPAPPTDAGADADAAPEEAAEADVGADLAADAAVLDELSQAFGATGDVKLVRRSGDGAGAGGSGTALGTVDRADDTDVPADAETSAPAEGRTTIAIGGGGDLPDARYLDEELDDGAGTVFIDDDVSHDAIATGDVAGPGIEPRIRQRRIGVRRAAGRRRLMWVAIVGGCVTAVVAVLALLGSSLFDVDDVDVTGARYVDDAVLAAVVDDLRGTPVLLVDTAAAENDLEADPWVESARVRTDFPGSATIEIRERVPVATMQGGDGRFRVLDREGRVLDVIDGQPIAFVRIWGTGGTDLAEGEFADVGYAAAANLVNKLTPGVRDRLDSILAVPDGGDLRLVLRSDPDDDSSERIEVRLGAAITDAEQIETLVRLERLLDDLDGSETAIDVSTEEATLR